MGLIETVRDSKIGFRRIGDNVATSIDRIGENAMGLPTGIDGLDKVLRGLRPGKLILLAGRSSMGKTALALDMALTVGKEAPVVFYSLEMDYHSLQMRAVCNLARLNHHRICSNQGTAEELTQLRQCADELAQYQVYVDDEPATIYPADYEQAYKRPIPSTSLNMKIQLAVEQRGCKAIFIDYLQLLRLGAKSGSESLRLHHLTWALHEWAKQYQVPIVLLSQLRRFEQSRYKEDGKRVDPRPRLDDLRDSGAIEQDSDAVVFVHRPSYYVDADELDMFTDRVEDDALLIVAKNRGGPTGTIRAVWRAFSMSWGNCEDSVNTNEW